MCTKMARVTLYFDSRRLDKEGRGQLRFIVKHNGSRALLALGISVLPEQWDNGMVVDHPDARLLNQVISIKKGSVDKALLEQTLLGNLVGKSARDVADFLQVILDPDLAEERRKKEDIRVREQNSFIRFFDRFLETKGNPGTRSLYEDTRSKILVFCEDQGVDGMLISFSEINKSWLASFESFCLRTQGQNTASRHLRDIRAVFNAAIDEELTTNYPFRKFKIKYEESRDKSYTASELRSLFTAKCYPGGEQEAVDIFKLMFCLIGINSIDLANASKACRGRIDYVRAKTHKRYSVKVEPEAQAIIRKYAGEEHLLDILERCPNYKTYFNRLSKTLRKVGKTRVEGKKSKGKAVLPDVCIGSARTSWATIAQSELDIPRDVIAAALGHHTVDVTTTYLRTDWRKKVDQANRRVLDWVFYAKRKD